MRPVIKCVRIRPPLNFGFMPSPVAYMETLDNVGNLFKGHFLPLSFMPMLACKGLSYRHLTLSVTLETVKTSFFGAYRGALLAWPTSCILRVKRTTVGYVVIVFI